MFLLTRNIKSLISRSRFWLNLGTSSSLGPRKRIVYSLPSAPFNQRSVNLTHHFYIKKKCRNEFVYLKVWLGLGLTLVVMIPVLAILSSLYLRYVNALTDHPYSDRNGRHARPPIISYDGLMHNASFLLSHLTNQGQSVKGFLPFFILEIPSQMNNLYCNSTDAQVTTTICV